MPSCSDSDLERFLEDLQKYDALFYKSLATNDHQWAGGLSSHQSGVLIPRQCVGFFGLTEMPTQNRTVELDVEWLLDGDTYHRSDMKRTGGCDRTHLKYYCEGNRKTRPEAHLTCVYNPYFESLQDGSLLLIGRGWQDGDALYRAIIIGSSRDDLLQEVTDATGLPDAPLWGVESVGPFAIRESEGGEIPDELLTLLQKMAEEIYSRTGAIPSTRETSRTVWELLREESRYVRLNISGPGISKANDPFLAAIRNAPGNLARWSLQKAEFNLVRNFESHHYPPEIIEAIRDEWGTGYPVNWTELENAIGKSLNGIVGVAKSVTNSRRSRAGKSFEWYVNDLLDTYSIEFEPQAGDRRLDFLLDIPSTGEINLSAKTSTRERWKQVEPDSY